MEMMLCVGSSGLRMFCMKKSSSPVRPIKSLRVSVGSWKPCESVFRTKGIGGTSLVSMYGSVFYKPGVRLYYPTFRSFASRFIYGIVSKLSLLYCGIKVDIDIERGTIMQEAAVSPLPTWQNFYIIIGTAAATLTGLMFVVI